MLIGGTGRNAGVSGSGPLMVRSTYRGLVKTSSDKGTVTEVVSGILVLKGFKYKKPSN